MVSTKRPAAAGRTGTERALAMPFSVGLALGAISVFVSAITGLANSGERQLGLLLIGVTVVLAALSFAFGRFDYPHKITPVVAMSMLVSAWAGIAFAAVMSMVVSGEYSSAGAAIFEAVSATTTTGFTVIDDPQALPRAIQILRVSMQWVSGLGVLIGGMGVLPVAVAGVELAPRRPLKRSHQIDNSSRNALTNIAAMYLLLTAALTLGYFIAGMPIFDAWAYAQSTASTGGMANHPESLAFFDSSAVVWVAIAGMVAAGANLMVVWWAIRGAVTPILHSTELRLYGSLLVLGTLSIWLIGTDHTFTQAAFDISSMLSTTGFRISNWALSGGYVEATLLIASGIGAMSGSVGSGFRLARVARVALEVRRSLRRLIHPRQVEVIRMDDYAVNELSLERTYGYLWLHVIVLAGVATLLNASNFDLVGTLTFALAAVSNVGVVVDGDGVQNAVNLNWWSSTVAATGMVLGRLSIYPVLITAAGFGRWLGRLKPGHAPGIRT